MSEAVAVEEPVVLYKKVEDHIAVITLNRPRYHNAVNVEVMQLLGAYVRQIEADPFIRVAILSGGKAKYFCAGMDLNAVADGDPYRVVDPEFGFAGFIYAKRSKPWIVSVQGGALGGGTEISLAADMIVAGESAFFALPEVKRGLMAGAAGAFRLPRYLPRPLAIEMVTLGERLPARRAYELGFVNRLVPDGTELEAALEMARVIAANAPLAVRESLAVTRRSADLDEDAIMAFQNASIGRVLNSPDAEEGAKAFLERREPVWRD